MLQNEGEGELLIVGGSPVHDGHEGAPPRHRILPGNTPMRNLTIALTIFALLHYTSEAISYILRFKYSMGGDIEIEKGPNCTCTYSCNSATPIEYSSEYYISSYVQLGINACSLFFMCVYLIRCQHQLVGPGAGHQLVTTILCGITLIGVLVGNLVAVIEFQSWLAPMLQIFINFCGYTFQILLFSFRPDPQRYNIDDPNIARFHFHQAIVVSIFSGLFLIVIFVVNSIEEIGTACFTVLYLTSIVENVLIFELFHLSIDKTYDLIPGHAH